jgi:uncharacterized membrane protein
MVEDGTMGSTLTQYIKPELLILVPVLFAAGFLLKRSRVRGFKIPFILGAIGIILSTIWTISTGSDFSWRGLLGEIFTGITQGILTAAVSDYAYQLVKQGQQAQACRFCNAAQKDETSTVKAENKTDNGDGSENKTNDSGNLK